ncbi:alpha/beta hydrolase [Lentzea sp. NPDC005914]|uniref:alpha/beta fold hydrolase n=1 Tax=Lentzea sp. NPDC005914 TaxID=3154572 RepID=UPI0033FB4D73
MSDIAAQRGARLVHANGIDIACTDAGDGPPLVLLHGALASTGPVWAGSRVAYVDHLQTLAKHFRVIAPDTRGSGATVHDGGPVTFDVLADDVVALIEALDLGPVLLAGFSEGAATATVTALRRPGLVRALVNHAGFDYFDAAFAEHLDQVFRPTFGGRPAATQADPDAAEQAFGAVPPMAETFSRMRVDYDQAQGEGYWRTYLGQFFERTTTPVGYSTADLAAISAPTLILAGDRDFFCTVEAACAAYRSLTAGELAIVPDTGHDITAAVIDTMTGFLTKV